MTDILVIQQRLNELGYTISPMFNNYGPKTTAAVKKFQKDNNLPETGIMDSKTYSLLFPARTNFLEISKQTIKKLIEFEVSSENNYNKNLNKPHWPGGASGVTIGLGYDLGYHTVQEVRKDWEQYLSATNLSRLLKVVGKKGASANAEIKSLIDIKINYDVAYKVFVEVSYVKYVNQTLKIYNRLGGLPPDAIGALVSLVYNRGNSLSGDSRKEMRDIVDHVNQLNVYKISNSILEMKRLWVGKGLNGLLTRRDWEASMVKNSKRTYKNDEIIKIYY